MSLVIGCLLIGPGAVCICRCFGTVTLHQSLVESLFEKVWSYKRSFLGLSQLLSKTFVQ
ncbi:putative signal peptide protein [Puccinia sorghi]|uniref:Putative signal peptide protein n=1 Tax=Puccinia sorghi TaxID=27349 RepID=A0A0L6VPW1_9BASI|nr:putative signal peptide protein [Puccinia sorghi]